MTTWVRGECYGFKPDAIEVTPTCVFVHKNFEQFEQTDMDGEPTGVIGWHYDVSKMSHGEYTAYAAAQVQEQATMLEDAIVELAEVIGGE